MRDDHTDDEQNGCSFLIGNIAGSTGTGLGEYFLFLLDSRAILLLGGGRRFVVHVLKGTEQQHDPHGGVGPFVVFAHHRHGRSQSFVVDGFARSCLTGYWWNCATEETVAGWGIATTGSALGNIIRKKEM